MYIKNYFYGLAVSTALTAMALLTVACVEDDGFFGNRKGKEVKFTVVEESDWNQTRGAKGSDVQILAPVKAETSDGSTIYMHTYVDNSVQIKKDAELTRTATTTEGLTEFNVIAYKYDKDETFDGQAPFFTSTATKGADNKFTMEKKLYWPSSDERYAFFAYYPQKKNSNDYWSSSDDYIDVLSTDATPQLEVMIGRYDPDRYGTDLITAMAVDQTATLTGENDVQMSFSHAMTAIRFELGELTETEGEFEIKNISFYNIANKGTYTFGEGWSDVDIYGSDAYSYSMEDQPANSEEKLVSLGSAEWYDDDDQYHYEPMNEIYMIPQEFTSDDQRLTVKLYLKNCGYIYVSMPLNGQVWEAGKTVTYVLSSSETQKPRLLLDNAGTVRSTWDGYNVWDSENQKYLVRHEFQEGDEVGMFVVQSDGTISASNVRCVCNGEDTPWTIGDGVFLNSDQVYYLYYPYKETLPGAPTKNSKVDVDADANQFFNSVVEQWEVVNDGTRESFNNSLLWGGRYELNSYESYRYGYRLGGTMPCLLSLVSLGIQTYNKFTGGDLIEYHLDTDENYTWETVVNPTYVTTQFSTEFPDNNIPISYVTNSGSLPIAYCYVVKPNVNTTLSSANNCDEPWSITCNCEPDWSYSYSLNGKQALKWMENVSSQTQQSYTMQVGDYYWSDGGLSHQTDDRNDFASRVGYVWYVDDPQTTEDDAFTEKGTVINEQTVGGHALVSGGMHLNFSKVPYWYPYSDVEGIANVTTYEAIFNTSNISGYANTIAATNASTFTESSYSSGGINLFYYLSKYISSVPSRSTGWFIPSAAQIAIPFKNDVKDLGSIPDLSSISVNSAVQNYISNGGWASMYSGLSNNTFFTSSEYDAGNVIVYNGSSYGFGYKSKSTYEGIWPFLAF